MNTETTTADIRTDRYAAGPVGEPAPARPHRVGARAGILAGLRGDATRAAFALSLTTVSSIGRA